MYLYLPEVCSSRIAKLRITLLPLDSAEAARSGGRMGGRCGRQCKKHLKICQPEHYSVRGGHTCCILARQDVSNAVGTKAVGNALAKQTMTQDV